MSACPCIAAAMHRDCALCRVRTLLSVNVTSSRGVFHFSFIRWISRSPRERNKNVAIQGIPGHTGITGNVPFNRLTAKSHRLLATVNCTPEPLGKYRHLQTLLRFLHEDTCPKRPFCFRRRLKSHKATGRLGVLTGSAKTTARLYKIGQSLDELC